MAWRGLLTGAMLLFAIVCCAADAASERNFAGPHVQVQLVSEVLVAAPGREFTMLFEQIIDDDWHTYWRNPGDSGAPPSVNWFTQKGVTVSDFSWPSPERIAYGPLMNYGYHHAVSLPVTVSVSDDFVGDTIEITVVGRVLVCADLCIPEKVSLSLSIPVGQFVLDESKREQFTQVRARLPTTVDVIAGYTFDKEVITLKVGLPFVANHRVEQVTFFPYTPDLIDNPAPQAFTFDESGISIDLLPGIDFLADSADLAGVVVVEEDAGGAISSSYEIFDVRRLAAGAEGAVSRGAGGAVRVPTGTVPALDFWLAVSFAFLGGIILNLMPCVFPVLSIKILSLVEGVHSQGGSLKSHGYVYAMGVVMSFVAIAAVLIALRLGGEVIGWGFQLQSPLVVGTLVYLFLLIGLNLLGMFEVGDRVMSLGGLVGQNHGYVSSFGTGVLATIVAAPCTAPFMGAAIGYALTQPPFISLIVFASLGLGMSFPYVLLCHSPTLLQKLPRPGPWMLTLKQFLAFPMFAAAIWLLWVLGVQTGADGMLAILAGCLSVTLAIWLWNQVGGWTASSMLVRVCSLTLVIGAVFLLIQPRGKPVSSAGASNSVTEYSIEKLAQAREMGPVFVNFTAAWCITCKVNDINALGTDLVLAAFAEKEVTYLKADWTNENPVITLALQEYGRSGVPLYLLYRQGDGPATVLPQILTESIVLEAVRGL